MTDLHGLMSKLNIMTWMIYRIRECREDHMKQLTEQGDVVLSDGEDERYLSGRCNQGTPH